MAKNERSMPLEFRCTRCDEVKDVRTLRDSICPECRARVEDEAVAANDATAVQRERYEALLRLGPHYLGALESWTPKDPILLADAQHFVCPTCKKRAHLVHDLAYRWSKKPYPIPNKYTPCDSCHRKETDDDDLARPAARNRFSRDR
jgi:Zn finger protein HypA/HybF involved in hydrogenase expression